MNEGKGLLIDALRWAGSRQQVWPLKRCPLCLLRDFTEGQLGRENVVSAIYRYITAYSDTQKLKAAINIIPHGSCGSGI